LWTGVQIPPAPPDASLKAANNIQLAAFFFCCPTPSGLEWKK